jgi:hypothetical protein
VKNYVLTLTSQQVLGNPNLLNHYLFVDPISGVTFTFPATSDGGSFSTSFVYPTSTNAGLFFPWGYVFQNTTTDIDLGTLKGPYTITFSPSGLDKRFFGVLKISYDFGDGTSEIVERDIVPNNPNTAFTRGDPANINITHIYWPKNNNITTYTPGITVLNGNLAQNIFNIRLQIVPGSIYELGNINLINIAQHQEALDETLGVFEINKPSTYVTNARFYSGGESPYNQTIPDQSFLSDNRLILNLDASKALSIIKNSDNKVSRWIDQTSYHNDFIQPVLSSRPEYKYDTTSVSTRKSVSFSPLSSSPAQSMTCINSTALASITGGFTACFVLKHNILGKGTIFGFSSGGAVAPLSGTEISQVLVYNKALNDSELNTVKRGLSAKWYIGANK